MNKLLSRTLLILLLVIFITVTALVASADTGSAAIAEGVVLTVGASESERGLAWFSDVSTAGEVRLAESSKVVGGAFPAEYSTFSAKIAPVSGLDSKYRGSATISGLRENTSYAYVIEAAGEVSKIYYFNTGSFGDYEFVFVGDPQVSTEAHGEEWLHTVDKIITRFDAELLISAGDQVTTPDSDLHYSYFLVDGLARIAFAPTVGPYHDSESARFGEHFNLPNLSTEYGVNTTSANYWYKYNNTLFMHLNMSDSSAATNGEHKSFLEEAIAANPNAVWKIVVMHNSLYSTGMHGDPSYNHFDSEIGKYRPALAPIFTELGIDAVLSGHDHVYLRAKLMSGTEPSGDVVTDGRVFDPDGTFYVCASSSTGSKFYDKQFDADFTAYENYEKRKSAIKFKITDTSLVMESYFLDDMTVFDRFAIDKVPHVCSNLTKVDEVPAGCIIGGKLMHYVCECGKAYEDAAAERRIENLSKWGKISATGHNYTPANCTDPAVCTACGRIKGEPLGHKYTNDCDTTCDVCEELRTVPPHPDTNSDSTCDECGISLIADDDGTPRVGVYIAIASAAVIVTGGIVTTIIFIRKRKRA